MVYRGFGFFWCHEQVTKIDFFVEVLINHLPNRKNWWCSYYSNYSNCQQKRFDSETRHLGKWKYRIEDSTQVRNMCFLFSLNSLKFPLTRETDTHKKLSDLAELLKSDNLQNTLVRWDKWLVDQASDVPSIIFFS